MLSSAKPTTKISLDLYRTRRKNEKDVANVPKNVVDLHTQDIMDWINGTSSSTTTEETFLTDSPNLTSPFNMEYDHDHESDDSSWASDDTVWAEIPDLYPKNLRGSYLGKVMKLAESEEEEEEEEEEDAGLVESAGKEDPQSRWERLDVDVAIVLQQEDTSWLSSPPLPVSVDKISSSNEPASSDEPSTPALSNEPST